MLSWAVISSEAVMNGEWDVEHQEDSARSGWLLGANATWWRTGVTIKFNKGFDQGRTTSGAFAGIDFRVSSSETAKSIKKWCFPRLCWIFPAGRCRQVACVSLKLNLQAIPLMEQPNITTRRCQTKGSIRFLLNNEVPQPNIMVGHGRFPTIPNQSKNCHSVNPPSLGKTQQTIDCIKMFISF